MNGRGAACLCVCAASLSAQTLEQLREQLRHDVRAIRFPTFLAAFLGLSEEAEMSGGQMRVDDGTSAMELTVLDLPWRREVELGEGSPSLVFEATVGYAKALQTVADAFGGALPVLATSIASRYECLGGTLALGPSFALGDGFRTDLIAIGGIGYVQSRADYGGPGAPVVSALFDGILFNWEATYAIYGGSWILRHEGWRLGEVIIEPRLRYDLRAIAPLATDDDAQDDRATVQWSVARLGFSGPAHFELGCGGVDWSADVAYKRFLDTAGHLLGFDDYVEVGAGLHWACERDLPLASQLALDGALLFGENIFGWTIGLSVHF